MKHFNRSEKRVKIAMDDDARSVHANLCVFVHHGGFSPSRVLELDAEFSSSKGSGER
jgi:hypothetical protein